MRYARALLMLLVLLVSAPAPATMLASPVHWTLDGTRFQGILIYDDYTSTKRPGLVMVPNWMGINAIAIEKAKHIAGSRYVILLTDMYGAAIRPANMAQAQDAIRPLMADRSLMRARIRKAYDVLKHQAVHAPINLGQLAAIGFCFGGTAVLDLARSGAQIGAAISFHGGLATDDPALAANIRARVLAINGADDSSTMPDVPAFTAEMRRSPADWQFVEIGHAVHCFTEAEATAPTGNCRYDAKATARSYRMMHDWLKETFRD